MPRVGDEIGAGIGSHGEGGRADRHMSGWNPYNVDHERNGKDRAAAAEQAQREADQAAGQGTQQVL